MRPRELTADRPALAGILVVVPARDEETEIAGSLSAVAAACDRTTLPVVVTVVLHRCTDQTAEQVAVTTRRHPSVQWVIEVSGAATLGAARNDGVTAGCANAALAGLAADAVWLANTDADSRVPATWLTGQHALADRGLDLVLGSVEPRDDGSAAARLWHAQHHLTDEHLGIHGANLGVRLSAYGQVGGFPELDDGEDVQLVHAVRSGAELPWTSTDRTRVITSSRRQGRAGKGFAGFLRQLDGAVATFGAGAILEEELRAQLLRIAQERGPDKTLCPSEAAGAVDPAHRRALTPLSRAVASALADEGRLVITQRGVPVDGLTASGPIRVGLPSAEMSV